MQTIPETLPELTSDGKHRRFTFVLLDQFTLLCFSAAMESLRIANRMAGRELYSWKLIGEGGQTVTCSAGTVFQVDSDLNELQRDDTIMVCGGIDVQKIRERYERGDR